MEMQEQVRQQEALRFCRWWSHHPDERELIRKILQEDCVEADLAQALGIVRNRQFYFLLPFLLRPPYIDRATETGWRNCSSGCFWNSSKITPLANGARRCKKRYCRQRREPAKSPGSGFPDPGLLIRAKAYFLPYSSPSRSRWL